MTRTLRSIDDEIAGNREKVDVLRSSLDESLLRRDYKRAMLVGRELGVALNTQRLFLAKSGTVDNTAELERVDLQRHDEEAALSSQIIAQAKAAVAGFERRLSAMEARHSAEIERLESKANEPSYGLPRLNPYLQSLVRSEEAYAKAGDFRKADATYQDVLEMTAEVYAAADAQADCKIEAMVRKLMDHHEKEKRRFVEAVSATKDQLDRALWSGLAHLRTRYTTMRRRVPGVTGSGESGVGRRGSRAYHALDAIFAPIMERAGVLAYTQVTPASGPEHRHRRVERGLARALEGRSTMRSQSVTSSRSDG